MSLNEAALSWFNDSSPRGILTTDAHLNIRGWNHWLESFTARPAGEMIGRNLLDVYPDLADRGFDKYYRDALAGQVSIVSQRLHGYLLSMPPEPDCATFAQMQQSARIGPLTADGKVIGTITVIDDVTERVERENRLVKLLESEKSARAEAEAANRAKDEFLATVSHELRTPLNAMLGWVQILRAGQFDQPRLSHALEAIERGARAQTRLIEDILDASRMTTGQLRLDVRPVDIRAIIVAVIDTVRPAADAKSMSIETSLDPIVGPVLADPNRLQQIIWNLLINAIKFTPKLGNVKIGLDSAGQKARVTVTDNGQGISPVFLPHVFDRFRQADSTTTRQHGGLGLGLAIVRHLVELHGGTVLADSPGEGCGATFTLELPLIAVPETSLNQKARLGAADFIFEPAGASPACLRLLDGLRVLVVDDEPDARDMLGTMFVQYGAQVTTAANSREALEALERWKPDVMVSDVGMPHEDGYSLISRIRALEPERGGRIPAVALTGYASAEDRMRLLSAGYQKHVTKPFEVDELAALVASFAGRTKTR